MEFIAMVLVGFVGGAVTVFFGLHRKRIELNVEKNELDERYRELQQATAAIGHEKTQFQTLVSVKQAEITSAREKAINDLRSRREAFEQELSTRRAEYKLQQDNALRAVQDRHETLEQQFATAKAAFEEERESVRNDLARKQRAFEEESHQLLELQNEYDKRVIKYDELGSENKLLKQELRKLNVNLAKLRFDTHAERDQNAQIDRKVNELGARYLKENVAWIGKSLNSNNFASCRQRLDTVIERCRSIGFSISQEAEESYVAELRAEYEKVVRAAFEREEQARIRSQIREEQKREREIQRELERVERERKVLQAALEKALAETRDQHSAEIESLRQRLADAEANERAISQAQLTKAGFVYVISNIGSFGEGVFKIGMTRRLDPLDRVRELGDASVPFPFDVHMMISCEDAPLLENAIHRGLLNQQVNKTNPRKEFFRADLDAIVAIVREHRGDVQYVADAEALQFRQSLTMSDDDLEFIEHVFDEVEDEIGLVDDLNT